MIQTKSSMKEQLDVHPLAGVGAVSIELWEKDFPVRCIAKNRRPAWSAKACPVKAPETKPTTPAPKKTRKVWQVKPSASSFPGSDAASSS